MSRARSPIGLLVLLPLLPAMACGGKKNSTPSGPLTTPPPADLAQKQIIIEQPKDGDQVDGQWVSVTGWIDRSVVRVVMVLGAGVPGFYLPAGHVGVPSVPVFFAGDGHFTAPRVPLQDGDNVLRVFGVTDDGFGQAAALTVTARKTSSVPATLVVTPTDPRPGQIVDLQAVALSTQATTWQWDYDGDGTFDEEAARGKHAYATAGHFAPMARTRIDGRWVHAATQLTVAGPPAVTHSATDVANPSRIVVVPRYGDPDANAAPEMDATRAVLVADGARVAVYSATLQRTATLTGFTTVSGLSGGEDGAIYVADAGANQIRAFAADGSPLTSFSGDGVLSAAEEPLVSQPRDLFVAVRDGQIDGLTFITDKGLVVCTPDLQCETPALLRDDSLPSDTLPSAQTVVPESWSVWQRGPSGPSWYLRIGDTWTHDPVGGGLVADASTRSAVQIAVAGSPAPTLLATLDGAGVVRQYDAGRLFQGLVGRLDPGYPVTALAIDAYATGRRLRQPGDATSRSHVIYYVGGQGRVDRVDVTRWWE